MARLLLLVFLPCPFAVFACTATPPGPLPLPLAGGRPQSPGLREKRAKISVPWKPCCSGQATSRALGTSVLWALPHRDYIRHGPSQVPASALSPLPATLKFVPPTGEKL